MANGGHILEGTKEFRRANLALFIAGFVTFWTLYDFQPLLPLLAQEFGVTPALSSLPLSVATFALAVMLPISGTLSEALGRRGIMSAAVVLTSLLTLAAACSPSLPVLIGWRLAQGVVLAGVPAVAMAYLSEEIEPRAVGAAMGLYIAGNALGGMTGRIVTAALADVFPWRSAIGIVGALNLLLALAFIVLLPRSRQFRRHSFRLGPLSASLVGHLRNPGLLCLFAISFTCMGGFVTLYNYVTFRLLASPYELSQSQAAAVFFAYLLGAFSSGLCGRLTPRLGRSRLLFSALAVMATGALLTLFSPLAVVVVGIVVFTVGFFGVHAVASAWVGARAPGARAQAASLYLFAYYLGSSISGTGGGFFWSTWGWPGVVLLILTLIGGAFLAAMLLRSITAGEPAPALQPVPFQPATE